MDLYVTIGVIASGAAIALCWPIIQGMVFKTCNCYCGPGKCECNCGCKEKCPCYYRNKEEYYREFRERGINRDEYRDY